MDDRGRLHTPGFVGKTFEETGVSEEMMRAKSKETQEAQMRERLHHGQPSIEKPMNRKSRRAAAKLGLRELERRRDEIARKGNETVGGLLVAAAPVKAE